MGWGIHKSSLWMGSHARAVVTVISPLRWVRIHTSWSTSKELRKGGRSEPIVISRVPVLTVIHGWVVEGHMSRHLPRHLPHLLHTCVDVTLEQMGHVRNWDEWCKGRLALGLWAWSIIDHRGGV